MTFSRVLTLAGLALLAGRAAAEAPPVWQPSPGHAQIAVWPAAAPDPVPAGGPEKLTAMPDKVAWVERVSQPTMTVYPPARWNSGVAVVVFPGGGYQGLAMDLEGSEICDWLASRGITGVLLKYRVPTPKIGAYHASRQALEDAQRTIGLVRLHADEWRIDPHRIGVIGFSAGGHMAAAVSTNYRRRAYPAMDAADRESSRPDFAIALYPGHLWYEANGDALNPEVPVDAETPPTFLLQAENDPVDDVTNSLTYYRVLKKAGVSAEMHLYAQGGHGFGLRRADLPIAAWPGLVETWLGAIGMLPVKPSAAP